MTQYKTRKVLGERKPPQRSNTSLMIKNPLKKFLDLDGDPTKIELFVPYAVVNIVWNFIKICVQLFELFCNQTINQCMPPIT